MLTKPKCWGHLCTPEALSLVNQMGTDWHDLAHLTRFEDLEHIVPQVFKIKFALKHKWFASGQIAPASVTLKNYIELQSSYRSAFRTIRVIEISIVPCSTRSAVNIVLHSFTPHQCLAKV